MASIQCVCCYEQQHASLFQAANHGNCSFISGLADYFVSNSSWIACESSTDSACVNYFFDIREKQGVVRHLFKEMWNSKLVLAISHFLSDDINDSQSRSFLPTKGLPMRHLPCPSLYAAPIGSAVTHRTIYSSSTGLTFPGGIVQSCKPLAARARAGSRLPC